MDIDAIKLALSSDSFSKKSLSLAQKAREQEKETTKVREHERRSYSYREKLTIVLFNDGRCVSLSDIPNEARAETWFPMVVSKLLEMGFEPQEINKTTIVRSEGQTFSELRSKAIRRK